MADPKYANLPGLDANSPEVFESNDLPEAERNPPPVQPEEIASENVERTSINTETAFKTFKGKSLSTGRTDFSDSVSKSRSSGYFTDKTEADYKLETPQQKYQRLQNEICQLKEEVSKLQENVTETGSGESISPVTMGKQLEHLQHQLTDLHLERLFGPGASVDLVDPQGALRQRLLSQLENCKHATGEKGQVKGAADKTHSPNHILYELYHRPEQAQFSKNARIATLEERLERLENVIGKNFDKMNVLTADSVNKSLIGAVATLNSKLSLLDAGSTETVEVRLNLIIQKMQQIAEKKEKEAQVDPDNQKRVSDLYDLVKKWETTADSLPQIVDRLLSLKELHEQGLQFSQALSYLDTVQQEVKFSMVSQGDMLKQLQASLTENSKVIHQNVESLGKRLKALEKS